MRQWLACQWELESPVLVGSTSVTMSHNNHHASAPESESTGIFKFKLKPVAAVAAPTKEIAISIATSAWTTAAAAQCLPRTHAFA